MEWNSSLLRVTGTRGQYTDLGIATTRIGGGVALAMRNDPTGGYWSKALGFGTTEPFTVQTLDRVLDFYREHGVHQAVLQLVASVLPGGLRRDRAQPPVGFTPGSTWGQARRPDPRTSLPTQTRLRIGPVPAAEARRWADVVLTGFGMPTGALTDMLTATVGGPTRVATVRGLWDDGELVDGRQPVYCTARPRRSTPPRRPSGHRGLGHSRR